MKSYRVRMTEGVEMVVAFEPNDVASDFLDAVDLAKRDGRLLRIRQDGPSSEPVGINPRHVLYVREVAE